MEEKIHLEFNERWDLNINDDPQNVCNNILVKIFTATEQIGFVDLKHYNQALLMSYGLDTTAVKQLMSMPNSGALLKLDQSLISRETINEIGDVINPNIVILQHFGIAPAWRNKGIGKQVLKNIINDMAAQCGYMIVLNSEPQQHTDNPELQSLYEKQGVALTGLEEDPDKAKWQLNAFWQQAGFRPFKDYDNVFICNVNQVAQKLVAHSA